MKKRNKKVKVAVAGMLVLAAVASTWAFFNSESRITNELYTKEYGADTIEKFKPQQELEPGTKVEKEVGVKNTGDYDLVVRIRMMEEWTRSDIAFVTLDSVNTDKTFNDAIISALKNDSTGEVTSVQTDVMDGLVAGDETVMYKSLPGLKNGAWTQGKDGWFYYATTLKAGASTELLMDFLTLAGDTDMGKYNVVQKYSETAGAVIEPFEDAYNIAQSAYLEDLGNVAKKEAMAAAGTALETAYAWKTDKPADDKITFQKMESTIDKNASGYAAADYTLTIVTQICQATKEAVEAVWPDMEATVKTAWNLR